MTTGHIQAYSARVCGRWASGQALAKETADQLLLRRMSRGDAGSRSAIVARFPLRLAARIFCELFDLRRVVPIVDIRQRSAASRASQAGGSFPGLVLRFLSASSNTARP